MQKECTISCVCLLRYLTVRHFFIVIALEIPKNVLSLWYHIDIHFKTASCQIFSKVAEKFYTSISPFKHLETLKMMNILIVLFSKIKLHSCISQYNKDSTYYLHSSQH